MNNQPNWSKGNPELVPAWYDDKPLTRRQRFMDAVGDIVWAKKHDAIMLLEAYVKSKVYHYPPFTIVDVILVIERERFTATAVAKCCPQDTYDEVLGARIARGRAMLDLLEQLHKRYHELGGFQA